MANPQYTSECPTWTPTTPEVTFRQISKCNEVTVCWDYDHPAPLQGWRIYRSNTPPSIDVRELCVSVSEDEVVQDAGNFNNVLIGYRGKAPGDPVAIEELEITKGTACGDINNLFTETTDDDYFGVCGLNSGGSFILNLDEPIQGIDEVSWRFQVSEASGGRSLSFYDTVTSQWVSISGPGGSSFQTVNQTFKTTSATDQVWQNGRFTRIQFSYGGQSSAPRVFKTAFLKLYKNGARHTILTSVPTYTVPVCATSPFLVTQGVKSINFKRELKEYVRADRGPHYSLGQNSFTLDFWFSKSDTPRVYHFPCETLICCYDSLNNQRAWRVWIEPTTVTDSQTPGTTMYSTDSTDTANLMIEFFERGDGTGGHVVKKIVELDQTGSPSPNTIASGLNNFTQVCILRDGNVFAVYVDGVMQLNWTTAFGVAHDSEQYLYLGRHFGDSERLDQSRFTSTIPADDGETSYFDGQMCDIRLIRNTAIYPPPGGTQANLCGDIDWPATFKIVDALPPYRRCWTDPSPPLGGRIYYKVAAVQCDEDTFTKCPAYLAVQMINRQQVPGFAVDNEADLLSRQQEAPPTLRDVFDTWDRCDPSNNNYYAAPNRGGVPHNAWYFSGGTFIQPENTSVYALIVCPPAQYQTKYTHRAIVTSGNRDDDSIGIVGAYYYDPSTGAQYALCFVRSQGGFYPLAGWGIVLLTNRGNTQYYGPNGWGDINGWSVGGIRKTPGAGWSGRTSAVEIVRDRNKITARCSSWRSSGSTNYVAHHEAYMDNSAVIEIDLNTTPPPPGVEGGWGAFQGPTGYGFMTISQADSKYYDWYLHPYPGSTIYDFSLGYPGRVWEYGSNNQWYLTPDTAWEAGGEFPTEYVDIKSGERHVVECDEVYFKS